MAAPHIGLAAIGGRGWMGGANYVRNLASAVRAAAAEARISWICGAALAPEWRDAEPLHVVPSTRRFLKWAGLEKRSFRRVLAKAEIDFLYPLTYDNQYNLGLDFPLGRALRDTAWAGWIPDFQHRYLPELFSPAELKWRDAQMHALVEEASRVVLSSRTALADFEKFYPRHAQKGALLTFRVAPIRPPTEDESLVADAPGRFFIVCNQFWKHKNHLVLFEALQILRGRGLQPPVLCTGALSDYRNDPYVDSLRRFLVEGGLEEQVQLLGLVPRDRQLVLMRRALAIIQPSLFEGWSTVVEDARALGRPTVLSDLPVHREQNPPGAVFFNPRAPEELAQRLSEAWQSLQPGPDEAAERAAFALATQQQLEFGRNFLALVERAR